MLRQSDLPTVLPSAEIARYQRVFALEDKGAWVEADREIAKLRDKLLLGHVLAARYLARSYHASYEELASWLGTYADEPDAKAIYELALARKPLYVKGPTRPVAASIEEDSFDEADPGYGPLSPHAALVARQIRSLALATPRQAEQLLAGPEARRLLDPETRGSLRAMIAEALLRAGDTQEALVLSASPQDGAVTLHAHWEAGLADWRLGRFGEAGAHFEALLQAAGHSPWLKSEASFWLARVALRARRPDHMVYWLGIAAEEPRTFYGLIARRLLGEDLDLHFDAEPFTALDAQMINSLDAGRRALALLAVGQRLRAAAELRALAQRDNPALLQSLAGVADRADLPALSLELAGTLGESDGRNHDGSLYPVPHWTPQGGFTVDRALLFALMRQESLFVPRVASASGALGLMQLMPATARDMAERTGMVLPQEGRPADEREALANPELNLTLAQEYVRTLLDNPAIKGNLLAFTLAYNQGPTAAQRFHDLAVEDHSDPLLFLESIPSQEARQFTKHVLTNYWIYRIRLGQETRDLDQLAAGRWPTYTALDPGSAMGGRYAANR